MRFSGFRITAIVLSIFFIASTSHSFPETTNKDIFKTSFDCAKATSDTEKTICSVQELAEADIEIGSIYNSLLSSLPSEGKQQLKQEQITWLKARNQCGRVKNVISCLKESYRNRIDVMNNRKVKLNASPRLRTTAADDISGRYEKIGEYESGELKVRKEGNDKIDFFIYATVTNFSCQLGVGSDYDGTARSAYAIFDNHVARYSDEVGCKLDLTFTNHQVTISTTEECNTYCGARAHNGMDGTYLKRSDTTESTKYKVLNFEFMDTGGAKYNSTKLLQQLKAKYGYVAPAMTLILVETSSFGNDTYKTQDSLINALNHDEAEKLRMLYVVACSSAEYKQGYHTSVETAKNLIDKNVPFRIRLLTEDGHVFNSSDYPLTAEDLKTILKNRMQPIEK